MTTDAKILTALRNSGDSGVAGTELSQELGISRAAVWAHIQELRSLGYEIEAGPHRGYRLLNAPDLLHSVSTICCRKVGPHEGDWPRHPCFQRNDLDE